jgi:hypothetical protein
VNLQLCILNVLAVSPSPITANVIAALAPPFGPKPPLPASPARAEAEVVAALEIMEETGDVIFQPHRDRGRLWSITKIGKARIA